MGVGMIMVAVALSNVEVIGASAGTAKVGARVSATGGVDRLRVPWQLTRERSRARIMRGR